MLSIKCITCESKRPPALANAPAGSGPSPNGRSNTVNRVVNESYTSTLNINKYQNPAEMVVKPLISLSLSLSICIYIYIHIYIYI